MMAAIFVRQCAINEGLKYGSMRNASKARHLGHPNKVGRRFERTSQIPMRFKSAPIPPSANAA